MLTAEKPRRGYSARDLMRCAEREAGKRKSSYPKWIAAGKMSQELADAELDKMQAIAEHFAGLDENERLI